MTGPRRETPPQRAVALAYHDHDPAPRLVAKGQGMVAEHIIEKARASGIYVHESPELVGLLMHVDMDTRIPESLYTAVAELLAWIYRLERNAAGKTAAVTAEKQG